MTTAFVTLLWFFCSVITFFALLFATISREDMDISSEELIFHILGVFGISFLFGLFIAPALVLIGSVKVLGKLIDYYKTL